MEKTTLEKYKEGTLAQRQMIEFLEGQQLSELLNKHSWTITGPLPLELETCENLVTICCEVHDRQKLAEEFSQLLASQKNFSLINKKISSVPSTVVSFEVKGNLKFQIIAQPIPLAEQTYVLIQNFAQKIIAKEGQSFISKLSERLNKENNFFQALAQTIGLEGEAVAALKKLATIDDWEYKIRFN